MKFPSLVIIATALFFISAETYAWEPVSNSAFNGCTANSTKPYCYNSCYKPSNDYASCMSRMSDQITGVKNYISSKSGDNNVYYIKTWSTGSNPDYSYQYARAYYMPESAYINDPISPPNGETIYNHVLTDSECQSVYGGSRIVTGSSSYDSFDAGYEVGDGACSLTWSGGVGLCGSGPDGDYCAGDFTATSTGEPAMPENTGGSGGTVSTFDPPDYMTPVDANDGICSTGSCVTIDGQTYHVDQDAIDNGTVTIGGDGDGGDGSGGDGGSGGDDGSGSGGDGSGSDGNGDGFDDTGIIGAINGLKTSLQNGFDGVVDGLSDHFTDSLDEFGDDLTSTDGVLTEDDVSAAFRGEGTTEQIMETLNEQYEETNNELTDRYQGLFGDGGPLGSVLASMRSFVTSFLPAVPTGGCSPVSFDGPHGGFTVDCEVFNAIKAALSFILFFFTAYEVTSIALSYRSS